MKLRELSRSRLLRNRLVLQLLFTFVAAACFAAVGALIIVDAVRGAESVVVGEAKRTLASALREVNQQHQYRTGSDPYWSSLPAEAKDVSLRGITDTVLRSYGGVEGGFYSKNGRFIGYGYPTHDTGNAKTDVPAAESSLIAALAQRSFHSNQPLQQVIRGKMDLLVLAAVHSSSPDTAIWVMKRLPGRAHSNDTPRLTLLVILVAAAFISLVGTLVTGIELTRGVAQIKTGLAALEKDFTCRLPERRDELGSISHAINRMAIVRGKLENDLRREDRLRALGRLAAGLAHEIRNPLNSIRLTVQLLASRLNTGRLRQTDLEAVQTEVDRLNALLNDLLDLQRVREPVLHHQPVLPVLNHCVSLLSRQAEMQGVYFEIAAGPGSGASALFDSQQLTQTIMNLLLNALEVSKRGDCVRIRISEERGSIAVEVADNGPGLGGEQQDYLFEPFYTTKPGGTGLGLAVSRELMRSQGGDLSYSPTNSGACFTVHIPAK